MVDRLLLKMPVRLGPMAEESPEAQILGGKAAVDFANALGITRSTQATPTVLRSRARGVVCAVPRAPQHTWELVRRFSVEDILLRHPAFV